jgi:hypothetical protein
MTPLEAYLRGLEDAEKLAASVAGDPRMYSSEWRRGAGQVQAAIRARAEAIATHPSLMEVSPCDNRKLRKEWTT